MKICCLFICTFILFSCTHSTTESDAENLFYDTVISEQQQQQQQQQYNIFDDKTTEQTALYQMVFPYILDKTYQGKPTFFKQKLAAYYNIKTPFEIENVSSSILYGGNKPVFLVQCYQENPDSTCLYPTNRVQFIFSHEGRLIYKNKAEIARFIPYDSDSISLYMTVQVDCKGMGYHHFYKYQEGKFVDLFNVIMNNSPLSYDANPQNGLFENKVLNVRMSDLNADGKCDIQLTGYRTSFSLKRHKKDTLFKRIPIDYRFIYQPTKDFFHWQDE